MTKITFSDALMAYLDQRHLTDSTLILITDDGGGKYSLQGGACSIGTNFSLIVVDGPDPDYPVAVPNDRGLKLWSSAYDLYFFDQDVVMDYQNGNILIKDSAHLLDSAVQIASGAEVLAAFAQGVKLRNGGC